MLFDELQTDGDREPYNIDSLLIQIGNHMKALESDHKTNR